MAGCGPMGRPTIARARILAGFSQARKSPHESRLAGRTAGGTLPQQLQAQLHLSRIVPKNAVDPQIGRAELGVIYDVEQLGPELCANALGDRRLLLDAQKQRIAESKPSKDSDPSRGSMVDDSGYEMM
jgi:hypothetical protein